MIARREWTRSWWNRVAPAVELVTSVAVIDELGRGEFPARTDCLAFIANLPVVTIDASILEIVEAYIRHRVMPTDPAGDALHLALASYHRCDFLVTWNCRTSRMQISLGIFAE